MKKQIIFWFHLILIILAWTSPFWLNWKWITGLIILNYIQIIIFKGCVLTLAQFEKEGKQMTIYTYVLESLGFKVNRQKMKFIARYIMPIIIFLIAILWQILLNKNPII